jgi:death-on-curing protein
MEEPRWISRLVTDAIHTDLLITHGGLPGLRDDTLLESALTRPRQRFAHDPSCDLASMAASYAYGLARNHPYADGNKRVAFVVMAVFLGLNDLDLVTDEADVVATMTALAAGELGEGPLAEWIRSRIFSRG